MEHEVLTEAEHGSTGTSIESVHFHRDISVARFELRRDGRGTGTTADSQFVSPLRRGSRGRRRVDVSMIAAPKWECSPFLPTTTEINREARNGALLKTTERWTWTH